MIPTPAEVRAARAAVNMTQSEAGMVVHVQMRTWQAWELGQNPMPAGLWELFLLKTAAIRTPQPPEGV